MGQKTVNPVSPTLSGATVSKTDSVGTTSSVLIAATTAQSSLNFAQLAIILENQSSTASVAVTFTAGDNYTEIGQGAKVVTVATAATVVVGGKDFESARFEGSDAYMELTFATASTIYVSAIMTGANAWNP